MRARERSRKTGKDLAGQLAGLNLSQVGPQALAKVADIGTGAGRLMGARAGVVNPAAAVSLVQGGFDFVFGHRAANQGIFKYSPLPKIPHYPVWRTRRMSPIFVATYLRNVSI